MGNYAPRLPVYSAPILADPISLLDEQWSALETAYDETIAPAVRSDMLRAIDRYLALHEAEANAALASDAVAVAKRAAAGVEGISGFACGLMYDGSDASSAVRSAILDRLQETFVPVAEGVLHERAADGTWSPYFDEGARPRQLGLQLDPDVLFELYMGLMSVAEGALADAQFAAADKESGFAHHTAFYDWSKSMRRICKAAGLPDVPLQHDEATNFSIFMRHLHSMLPADKVSDVPATDRGFARMVKAAGRP